MKKIFSVLLLTVALLTLGGCGAKDAALKAQIESGKRHCPMSMGMAGKLTSMSYDSDSHMVKFVLTLNKSFAEVKDLEAAPDMARESMRLALSKGDMKKLTDMMVDADAGLEVVYKNKGSKDEFTITFTPAELKEIASNPMSEEETGKMQLATMIKGEKARIPYKIDSGLNVTDVTDNGSALVYTCSVDEDEYDIDQMAAGTDELKTTMKGMLKDLSMKNMVKLLAELDHGFEYHYVGATSGKEVTVAFSADEIKALAKKK